MTHFLIAGEKNDAIEQKLVLRPRQQALVAVSRLFPSRLPAGAL